MRAFWGGLAGWILGQAAPLLFVTGTDYNAPLPQVLEWSLTSGSLCALMVGCLATGLVGVPAGGCAPYVVGWALLLAAAYQVFTGLGLPDVLVVVVALTGLLVGFCVPGEGAITIGMVVPVLVIGALYGVATLFLPPTASVTAMWLTLAGLAVFVVGQFGLARRLKRK